jgi:hypothetical protein
MKAIRRPAPQHEHEFEPQPGLPEELPAGENILWQGAPDWRVLARRAFHFRKLAAYFALLLAWRATVVVADGGSGGQALEAALALTPLAAIGLGLVAVLAWLSARTALYTLTDKRIVMRIGIVLTVTYNLPYKRLAGADLALLGKGAGDIALTLAGDDRIAWLQLWPHARPWRFVQPQPSLRAVPEAQRVAQTLARAWAEATGRSPAATTGDVQPGTPMRAVLAPR